MKSLRPYQQRAWDAVAHHWERVRRVLLVCPTGGGKTFTGARIALSRGGTVLWVAHRRELVTQAAAALASELSELDVAIVKVGPVRHARVYAGTVQTLIAREWDTEPAVLVLDEAHHYAADEWKELAQKWPNALTLGLTATPERQDGRPLGDLFDELVVAASYSELLEAGHLCEAVTYRPGERLQRALATDPIEAYRKHAPGAMSFAFFPTIKDAREWADKFTAAGFPARSIDAKTPAKERAQTVRDFRDGAVRVLTNVHALTEGVDVPEASCVILGRTFGHVGAYMQAVGRVLRPHPGKERATVLDLTGATHVHGFATEDRIYSLEGRGIRQAADNPVRNCLTCGVVYPCELKACPECGATTPPKVPKPQRIYSLELEEVWAGENTPDTAKRRELDRLVGVAVSRGFGLDWAAKQYRELFGEKASFAHVDEAVKAVELARLRKIQQTKGLKPGFVGVRYKDLFGVWPRRSA